MHCAAPHCATLHRTALHCTAPHCTTPHRTAPHCAALHVTALRRAALHCSAVQTALHCTTLHRIALLTSGLLLDSGLNCVREAKSLKFGEESPFGAVAYQCSPVASCQNSLLTRN